MIGDLTELQREKLKQHKGTLVMHMKMTGGHHYTYRFDSLGVTLSRTTQKRTGAVISSYTIDGDERAFDTVPELVAALEEKGVL